MRKQRTRRSRHLEPQQGIDIGFAMPIDLFIDVARMQGAPMMEFTVHAAGFPRPHDTDVMIYTVRARCLGRENGTERLQFRVYGILPSYLVKKAISHYLRAKKRYLPDFEIERQVYQ